MKIRVNFTSQIRDIAGKSFEEIEIKEGISLRDALEILTRENEKLKAVLLDEKGVVVKSNLLIINGVQVAYPANPILKKNDEITLMSPISGG